MWKARLLDEAFSAARISLAALQVSRNLSRIETSKDICGADPCLNNTGGKEKGSLGIVPNIATPLRSVETNMHPSISFATEHN
jgi:hypothetical protein